MSRFWGASPHWLSDDPIRAATAELTPTRFGPAGLRYLIFAGGLIRF
ncbi:MAG: hypothetical protein WA317_14650 [Mycobacterium sp.]